MKPLSVYVHFPFCKSKCFYCDFNSITATDDIKHAYVCRLVSNIKLTETSLSFVDKEVFGGYEVQTIYFGGGTPSLIPVSLLYKVKDAIYSTYKVSQNIEWTIEINPETVTEDILCSYKDMGINRLSFGVQTFNDEILRKLNRIHTKKQAIKAIETAKRLGFTNISLDLMFNLPNETLENFKESLKQAVSLNPQHISCYSLILEEGTELYRQYEKGKFILKDDENDRNMYHYMVEFLHQNGYLQYEISNFKKAEKTNYASLHNTCYWIMGDYIGYGVSAHSYIDGYRFYETDDINEYINGKSPIMYEKQTVNDKIEEFMFLGLRMTEGISKSRFNSMFYVDIEEIYDKELKRLISEGLILENGDNIRLTPRGIDVSNYVFSFFIK